MAAHRNRSMQWRWCAPRQRRLLLEQFEPRQMLSAAPNGSDTSVAILENTAYTFAAADFGFSDPNDTPPNAFWAVKLTTRAGLGVVTSDGTPVGVGQFVPLADISAGKLKFTPATGGNGLAYASFRFQVQDSGSVANGGADLDPSPNTFTIDVTPLNSAPSGRDNNYVPLFIVGSAVFPHTFILGDFGFGDSFDSPANNFLAVKITTLPAVGGLTNNDVLVTAGQFVSAADIAAGRLKYSVPNIPGSFGQLASFTFQVQDDGGTTSGGIDLDPSPNIVRLELDIPCGGCFPVSTSFILTTLEDTQLIFAPNNFAVHSPTGVPQNLKQVRIESLPTQGTLFLDGFMPIWPGMLILASKIADGQFRYIPPLNMNFNNSQTPTFSYRAEDDNGLDFLPFTIGIVVTPVNDTPLGQDRTVTALEDTTYTFGLLDLPFFDPNDSPQNALQAINITSLPATGALLYNGVAVPAGEFVSIDDILAGKLKFTSSANTHGAASASFTFRVQDNGGTANGGRDLDFQSRTLTIDVTQVNDPPSGSNRSISVRDCGDYVFSVTDFGFHDPNDFPSHFFSAVRIATLPTGGTLTNNGTALTAGQFISVADIFTDRLRFTLTTLGPAEFTSFAFQVQDNGGTAGGGIDLDQTPNVLGLSEFSPPDRPPFTFNLTRTTPEDRSYVFLTEDFPLDDFYSDALKSVTIGSVILNGGSLTNNGVVVGVGQNIAVADIAAGKFRYTPPANASGAQFARIVFGAFGDGGTCFPEGSAFPTDVSLSLNVIPVNDPPSGADKIINPFPGSTLLEDGRYAFSVADFGFIDPNDSLADQFLALKITTLPTRGTLSLGGASITTAPFFVAAANISALSFAPAPNEFGQPYALLTFQVRDNGGTFNGGIDVDPTPNTITFNVQGINDAPSGSDGSVTLWEDRPHIFSLSDFGFSDPNDTIFFNDFLAIRITTLPTTGALFLRGNQITAVATAVVPAASISSGELRFVPAVNTHGTSYSQFTFQVQDSGGIIFGGLDVDPTPNRLTFDVTPVNDPPLGTDSTVAVLENSQHVFVSADFGFIDPLDSPANSLLAVRIATLPTLGALTHNNFSVTVGQVISTSALAAGQFRYTPPANLNGAFTSFSFFVQDDGGTAQGGQNLSLVPNTLTLFVVSPCGIGTPSLSRDSEIYVVEDQNYVLTYSTFALDDPLSIPPGLIAGVKILSVPANGSLTVNGVPVAQGQTIPLSDITNFRLRFQPPANAFGNQFASLVFQVVDSGEFPGICDDGIGTITMHVIPVNDPPSGTDKTLSMVEDGPPNFQRSDFGFADPNDLPQNTMAAVKIVMLPTAGRLEYNDIPVIVGQLVAADGLHAGLLRFVPAPNAYAATYTSFTFQVMDNGGTANGGLDTDPTPNTITMNVASANDPPLTISRTISIGEDQVYTFMPTNFAFSDPNDTPSNALWSVILTVPWASMGTLRLNGVAMVPNSQIVVLPFDISRLTFTPSLNANNLTAQPPTVGFQVKDDGGTANGGHDTSVFQSTITFDVGPVNDAPMGRNNVVTTVEDSAHTFTSLDFGFNDPSDDPSHNLAGVYVVTPPQNGTLYNGLSPVAPFSVIPRAAIDNGDLRFIPDADQNGELYDHFTFRVQDDGGTVSGGLDADVIQRTMLINVTPVNDPPSLGQPILPPIADESGPLNLPGWSYFFAGPVDEAGQQVQFFLLENTNPHIFATQPTIDASGKLVFAPQPNAKGLAQISVVLKDDGGTANGGTDMGAVQTLTIEVFKSRVWHNALQMRDVSGDGLIVAGDALDIINFLNAFGPQPVPSDGRADGPYYDCNGDGFVTAADALAVINHLNAFGPGPDGEGEAAGIRSQGSGVSGPATDDRGLEELTTLLAIDVAAESRKKRT